LGEPAHTLIPWEKKTPKQIWFHVKNTIINLSYVPPYNKLRVFISKFNNFILKATLDEGPSSPAPMK
jgi:hypothetical protein